MLKKFPFLVLAILPLLAPRGAAAFDFNSLSGPLTFTEARTPAVPAPVKAAPACRPFLISSAFGGVSEILTLERACTAENEPIWALTVEVRGQRPAAVRISSYDYPAERTALEKRIKSMAANGISQEDADFIVTKTGPALKLAAAAAPADQAALLAGAQLALKKHLARP